MATPTYTLIEQVNQVSFGTVTFTNLSSLSSYRDLIIVFDSSVTGDTVIAYDMTFNNDTSTSNYSQVLMKGNGSSAYSTTQTAAGNFDFDFGSPALYVDGGGVIICQIFDFLATDKHKSLLTRLNYPSSASYSGVAATAGRYASTSAINEIDVKVNSSSLVSLYGIEA